VFQILKVPSIDFMKRGRLALSVSAVLCLASVVILAVNGLNLGIEFAGGTELQLKFRDQPDLSSIRSTLGDLGIPGATVTTIGAVDQHEVYIKIASGIDENSSTDLTRSVSDALRADSIQPGLEDLNVIDGGALEGLLGGAPGLTRGSALDLSEAITEYRTEVAMLHSVGDLSAVQGMTPEIITYLEERCHAGPVLLRSQSYIGPAIGKELMRNALGAIIGSLIGMLVYIWIRFQLQWGFAAVIALAHDTLITLGLFSLFGKEMSLPVVAAFLTLVGYSVNDTVVVFDRIRENLRLRAASGLRATVNLSINQTLSRTIITSGLTFIVVFGLFLFGGGALNSFAFVLTAGVVVGTYSSINIASPILVLWKERRGRGPEQQAEPASAEAPRRARRVRTGAAK
jgi:preprotein translocase subunit SecF